MIKRNCIIVGIIYLMSVFTAAIFLLFLAVKSEEILVDQFKSDNIVLNGMEISDSRAELYQPTSMITYISREIKKLRDIKITVKNISDEPITCQIYYTTREDGRMSGDLSSALTVLKKGDNIIEMPAGAYLTLRFTFRTINFAEAFVEISSINFTDNLNHIFIFICAFLTLTVLFLIVFIAVGITKEKKRLMRGRTEAVVRHYRKILSAILAFIVTLGLECMLLSGEVDVADKVNTIGYFIKKMQIILSQETPTVQTITFTAIFVSIYYVIGRLKEKILSLPALILSVIFTLFTVMGDSFRLYDSLDIFSFDDYTQVVLNILTASALFVVFYLACAFFIKSIEIPHTLRESISKNRVISKLQSFYKKRPVLSVTLLILLFWLPYIIVYYPGIIPADTAKQLDMWFSNGEWSNASPLFSTFTVCFPIEIGRLFGSDNFGVFLFSGTQSVILAGLLSYSINMMKKSGVPSIIYRIWLISILILPVYPCSAIQVGKDTNFTICVIILTIFLYKIIREPDSFFLSWKPAILLTIIMVYMSLVRHNGIYLIVPSFGIAFLFVKRPRYFVKVVSCFLSTIIVYGMFNALVPKIISDKNLEKGIITEERAYEIPTVFSSVAHSVIGRIVRDRVNELTQEQVDTLSKVYVNVDRIAEVYNPELSDYVGAQWRKDVDEQSYSEFKRLFVELVVKYPDTAMEAFLNKFYSYLYGNSAAKTKDYLWLGINSYAKQIEDLNVYNNDLYMANHMTFYAYMCAVKSMPLFSFLSYVGIYTWILIFVIIMLLFKKDFKALLVVLPVLLSLAVCIMSPVNGYIRYALPIMMGAPILLTLCYCSGWRDLHNSV